MLILISLITLVTAEVHEFDVKTKYGITQSGIAAAINESKNIFADEPNATVILFFTDGTYRIDHIGPGIYLDSINPGKSGQLIFNGAGMDSTKLVFANMEEVTLYGKNVSRITIKDMHFTRIQPSVTQGIVKENGKAYAILEIPEGFPTPPHIYNDHLVGEGSLRKYKHFQDPELVTENNEPVPWIRVIKIEGEKRRWRFDWSEDSKSNYTYEDLLAVKPDHYKIAYNFTASEDIVFQSMKWTRQASGMFRNCSKIRFSHCRVDRDDPISDQNWCLSTASGGPFFGWLGYPTKDIVIDNFNSEAVGGDFIEFLNVVSNATISNSLIKDTYYHGIALVNSPIEEVKLVNNTLIRSDIYNATIPA